GPVGIHAPLGAPGPAALLGHRAAAPRARAGRRRAHDHPTAALEADAPGGADLVAIAGNGHGYPWSFARAACSSQSVRAGTNATSRTSPVRASIPSTP